MRSPSSYLLILMALLIAGTIGFVIYTSAETFDHISTQDKLITEATKQLKEIQELQNVIAREAGSVTGPSDLEILRDIQENLSEIFREIKAILGDIGESKFREAGEALELTRKWIKKNEEALDQYRKYI